MSMNRRHFSQLFLSGSLAALSGCQPTAPDDPNAPVRVVVSIAPYAWLVEQLGGPQVQVLSIVQSGESPETFQPGDRQMSQIARCQLYFICGFPFEYGRQLAAVRSLATLQTIDLRTALPRAELIAHDCSHENNGHNEAHEDTVHETDAPTSAAHESESADVHAHTDIANQSSDAAAVESSHTGDPFAGTDFHTWLNPLFLKRQAVKIREVLTSLRPQHQAFFEERLVTLQTRLDQLDTTIREKLAPYANRAFLVLHPAWGYFAKEYGLRQLSMHSEGKQPSDSELTELQKWVASEKIRTIFAQQESGLRTAQTLANSLQCRAEVLPVLDPDVCVTLQTTVEKLVQSFKSPS